MSMPKSRPYYTADQYLKIERGVEDRYEYRDGEIYAMAGESSAHGDISANIVIILGSQLRGKSCRVRTKDTKVRSGPAVFPGHGTRGMLSYPDVLVICGEPEFHDDHQDVILNPKVILEVLSPATEALDRGDKFSRYQAWNPTLSDYVLVSQDRPQIEHFQRKADGSWKYQCHTGLQASAVLDSIQCTLPLAEVYERVTFPEG